MSTQTKTQEERLIFRQTDKQKGRHVAVSPDNSAMKHLGYGRIILDEQMPSITFDTGDRELGLICMTGKATVTTGGESYSLTQYDSIYIPRDSSVEIETDGNVDFVECSAEVDNKYPIQV